MAIIINFLKNNIYLKNTFYSLLFFFILKIIWHILSKFNQKINDEKEKYFINKWQKTLFIIIYIFIFLIIWYQKLEHFITLISFISAALTLALRDIIYNYFCGLYIKIAKPIKVEDRIQIGDLIGDVVNLNFLSFEILEVIESTTQSSGKIVHIPNTVIFSDKIKNYNTAFKYIWDEVNIYVSLNEDVTKIINILNNILNNQEIIKETPKKAQKEINKSSSNYRIYYNKLTPIIYTKIVNDKLELSMRFLIHPKKQRIVESAISEAIIKEFKKDNITLL